MVGDHLQLSASDSVVVSSQSSVIASGCGTAKWATTNLSALVSFPSREEAAWSHEGSSTRVWGESNRAETGHVGAWGDIRRLAEESTNWNDECLAVQCQNSRKVAASAGVSWLSEGKLLESAWRDQTHLDGEMAGNGNWSADKLESGRWQGPNVDQSHSSADDVFDVHDVQSSGSTGQGWDAPSSPTFASSNVIPNLHHDDVGLWQKQANLEPRHGAYLSPAWPFSREDEATETSFWSAASGFVCFTFISLILKLLF